MIKNKWVNLALCILPFLSPTLWFGLAGFIILMTVNIFNEPLVSLWMLSVLGSHLYIYFLFCFNTYKQFKGEKK